MIPLEIKSERAMTLSRKWWESSAEHISGDEEPSSYNRAHLDIGDLMILSMQGSVVDLSEYIPSRNPPPELYCDFNSRGVVTRLASSATKGITRSLRALRFLRGRGDQ